MSLKVNNVVLMRNISEFLYLPKGKTSERPPDNDCVVGMIRYNTDLDAIELYSNGAWNSLPAFSVSSGIGTGANVIYSWGSDSYGESFGTPGTISTSPVRTSQTFDFKKIITSKDGNNTFLIKNDDTLWVVGENRYGELGLGDKAPRVSITQLGAAQWSDISCYGSHVAAIKIDGSLWSWGANTYGQLGDGTTTQSLVPKQVGSLTDWVGIACGPDFTIGIRSGTTSLWATGRNDSGQLGVGNTNSPKTVMTPCVNTVSMGRIFCGKSSAYAVSLVGGLYSWGSNTYGQLGRTATTNSPTPTGISGFSSNTHSASISVGAEHVLIAHYDGKLYGFGRNDNYQLGTGNTTNQTSPYIISSTGDWWFVSAGTNFSMGLRGVNTGNLWVWGDNSSGQLGTGDTQSRSTPYNISGSLSWSFLSTGIDSAIGSDFNPVVDYGGKTFTSNPPAGYTDWQVPPGVTSICIAAIGGGGGGGRGTYGNGGGGGGAAYANNIKVNPGDLIRIIVGLGGNGGGNGGIGFDGGTSSVSMSINGVLTKIIEAYGGTGGTLGGQPIATGGSYLIHSSVLNRGGFTGGDGGGGNSRLLAGPGHGSIYIGSGGGGGASGGGTGNYGIGGDGGGVLPTLGGNRYSTTAGGGGGGGQLGAGLRGGNGVDAAGLGAGTSVGGTLGGGGGGVNYSISATTYPVGTTGRGGNGAVRIIWGYGRAFPSFLTEKIGTEP